MQLSTHLRRTGLFLALLLGALVSMSSPSAAQTPLEGLVAGRSYVIAFPDTTTNTFDARFPNTRFGDRAMLYLYSAVATRVTITGQGYNRTLSLAARKFTVVDFTNDTIRTTLPTIIESGQVSRKTFRITAEHPILVTCYLLTRFGTEAWTALPVDFWGTEYYAAALPGEVIADVSPGGEFDYNSMPRMAPAEILIVAAYDDTRISISPKGELLGSPRIANVVLNAGEAYQVQSRVDTSLYGELQSDLGGSYIFATRPIGVISGNTRAQALRRDEGLGKNVFKNMLIEWLTPITMHGTRFVYTPTWDPRRPTGEPNENPSDKRMSEFVRVYGTSAGRTSGVGFMFNGPVTFTVDKGKFFESRIAQPVAAYFTTDKPAQVMMNSTAVVKYNGTTTGFGGYIGAQYDGWGGYMTELVPVERWTSFAPYYASVEPSGMEHYINVVTDSANAGNVYMENGSRFNFNRGPIAGSPYVWGTMAVSPGKDHWLEGRNGARFSGHVYGLYKGHEEYRPGSARRRTDPDGGARQAGGSDGSALHPSEYEEYLGVAYGYPLTSAGTATTQPTGDSLEISTSYSCPDLTIRARVVNPNPAGIAGVDLQSAINTRIKSIDTLPNSPNEWIVVVSPVDPSRDASAVGVLRDRTGKSWTINYSYTAERVAVTPDGPVDFGRRTNEDEGSMEIVITNPMDHPVEVRDVLLARGNQDFSILDVNPPAPTMLPVGGQMRVTIMFSTGSGADRTLRDTLLVRLGCYDYRVQVTARVVTTTGVGGSDAALGNALHRNDPNPASGATTIRFTLGRGADTRLELYSATGEKVATLVDGYRSAGEHAVTVDAGSLAAGVYYYRISSGSWSATEAMVVR